MSKEKHCKFLRRTIFKQQLSGLMPCLNQDGHTAQLIGNFKVGRINHALV